MDTKIIKTGTANLIKKRKFARNEDLSLLKKTEKILKDKRPYIVTEPKHKEVVALWSGGLDSTINLHVLMEVFRAKVYPVFIDRGQTNYQHEKKSVDYFSDYFSEKYPNLFHPPEEISLDIPAKVYKDRLRKTKNLDDNSGLRKRILYPARNPVIVLAAVEYAYSLQVEEKFPKTVSVAFMREDPALHSTLTSLRVLNLYVCHILDDFNWQLISIPLEKEFGNYYGTRQYVKWASKYNLEVEKTRSCYKDSDQHCGVCGACKRRRKALSIIDDKTQYQNN